MSSNGRIKALTIDEVVERAPAAAAKGPSPSVSDRYVFMPTLPVIEELASHGWVPVAAKQAGTSKGDPRYAFHVIRFREKHGKWGDAERGDEVFEIVVANAHNGRVALRMLGGVFVVVCGNGLVVCEHDLGAYVGAHVGGVRQIVAGMMKSWPAMVAGMSHRIEGAKAITLDDLSRRKFANGVRQEIWGPGEGPGRGPQPIDLLKPRAQGDNTLWGTFNAVQQNVVEGGVPVNGRKRLVSTRGIRSARRDMDANRKMWGVFSSAHDWIAEGRGKTLAGWHVS